jgi:hypothetical protein
MGCAAALNQTPRFSLTGRIHRLTAASQQIVSKLDSYALRPESKTKSDAAQLGVCPEGVGAWLAGDGVRSSPDQTPRLSLTGRIHRFTAASQKIVS